MHRTGAGFAAQWRTSISLRTVFAQGVFTTTNAGYGPAAFSNLLVVRP